MRGHYGKMSRRQAQNTRNKKWCFTLNNYTDEHVQDLARYGSSFCSYLIYGKEVGEAGTPHLQGYMELASPRTMLGIKRLFGINTLHLERALGSWEDNYAYCTKEDKDPFEFGKPGECEQGSRRDLEVVRRRIREGATEIDIADEFFSLWVQYRRSFNAYIQLLHGPVARPDVKVYVFWGWTGAGKTRLATSLTEDYWLCSDVQLKWFDGYNNQKLAIIDDYRGDCSNGAWVLRLLDIYRLMVPIKGGFVAWNPKVIIMTSNMDPNLWHNDVAEPLMRRITGVFKFTEGNDGGAAEAMSDLFIADEPPNENL